MKESYVVLLLKLLLLSSCSKMIYFTNETRSIIENASMTPDKLQYYISNNIKLSREVSSGNANIKEGKIKFIGGKYVNIIYLKKLTPGICISYIDNKVSITFEKSGNNTMEFCVNQTQQREEIYELCEIKKNKSGINYAGEVYSIEYKKRHPSLVVKENTIMKYKAKSRVMKGRKI